MKKYLIDWNNKYGLDARDILRIEALEPVWDLGQGWHPDVDVDSSFYDPIIRRPLQLKKVGEMPQLVRISPQGAVTGHVMLKDSGHAALIQPDESAPIAPIFTRDLAGRIIYTGIVRHKNNAKSNPHLMPMGSVLFDESNAGFDLLERVFFCSFRPLEMTASSPKFVLGSDGLRGTVQYSASNLYPYKLRLDTFYQDGWRIPQTERLYVSPTNEKVTAEKASADLMDLWKRKPEDKTYEQFVEENEATFEDFFKRGCTLIPTVEAYNGLNKVDDDFTHTGFWPGRAVVGLHEVVSQQESDAPQGTILKVLEPGYVTQSTISPARVIVSDGLQYQSQESERYSTPRPKKLYPDLRLPHQRLAAKWGASWLPQHPADFEEPALWGWDGESNGRFVQLRGPVWDPLHYYYSCTPKVIESHRKNRLRRNVNLVRIPDEMLTKFHPVVEMQGFDSFDLPKKSKEIKAGSLLPTSIYHHADPSCITKVGYHPMPIAFEYELDNWWFPDLAPKVRVSSVIPLNVETKLAPVILPNVSPDRFLASVAGSPAEAPWITDPLKYMSPRSSDIENYPELNRYLNPDVSEDDMISLAIAFLAEPEEDEYPINHLPTNLVRAMEENWPGLYQVFLGFSKQANRIATFRENFYKDDIAGYVGSLWYMTPIEKLFDQADEERDPKKNLPTSAVSGSAEF